jgi:hypothetical protein
MNFDGAVKVVNVLGEEITLYKPQLHQVPFHTSNVPNLLALGTRGTGKSHTMRWDIIIRCLIFPNFRALLIRRKLTDLRKSHLMFIAAEAEQVGAKYRQTTMDVTFPNGSFIQFSHCESDKDVENYLSSQWDYIGFDELSTFSLEQFLKISAATRTLTTNPYTALVRACSNPLGPGAAWMKQWFIDKDVDYAEYPDYNPDDFEMQFSTLHDNKFIDIKEYEKRLKNLPDHVRRAWLLGEFVNEGAYFSDFRRFMDDGSPWHVINTIPTWQGQYIFDLPWINIYRAIDWGYSPDPAVCLWFAVLPNHRVIVFKERTWKRTLATDVAADIKRESEGMHIVETFCDPTMFIKTGNSPYSIAELFEQNRVPCTPSQNDRELYGYSVHHFLNTLIDEKPQLQIVGPACPELVKTFPLLQMDKNDPRKIADGNDHWVIACAYFCMGQVPPSHDPVVTILPRWMMPKVRQPRIVG